MADSWEDEEFDLPSAAPPTTVPVSWEDEVRLLKLRRSSRSCPPGLLQGKGEVLTSGYIIGVLASAQRQTRVRIPPHPPPGC